MKRFSDFHPIVLMIYFLSVLSVIMFINEPLFQMSALLGGICYLCMITHKKTICSDLRFCILMFILISITNPLFSHKGITILFFINDNPITLEALMYGISLGVMICAVIIWCKAYTLVMTSDKFLCLFGRIIPKMALVLSMTLKFIPTFIRQFKLVARTQKAMGLDSSESLWVRIKSKSNVLNALISWAIENSIETSNSMKARGYGMKNRTDYTLYVFHKKDALLLSICVVLVFASLFCISLGIKSVEFYPIFTVSALTPISALAYFSFIILSFLPFIIEVKEAIAWKYYVSKI